MTIFYNHAGITIHQGHTPDILKKIPNQSINCVVTSPPYYGLRDYDLEPQIWDGKEDCEHIWLPSKNPKGSGDGMSFRRDKKAGQKRGGLQPGFCQYCNAWCGQLGLEPNLQLYVHHLVQIFNEIKRILKKDGTVWLNLKDSYASGKGSCFNPGGGERSLDTHRKLKKAYAYNIKRTNISDLKEMGLKPKDLCMIPARVALALQAEGWWVRQEIVWYKPNGMTESVKDRCTFSHEKIFMLTKSARYFYDGDAIKEKASSDTIARYARGRSDTHKWADGGPFDQTIAKSFDHMLKSDKAEFSNKRSVWIISTQPFSGPHFAAFPEEIPRLCILAGCPEAGTVLDPFMGSGRTLIIAKRLRRKGIGIDLSPTYCEMPIKYLSQDILQFKTREE